MTIKKNLINLIFKLFNKKIIIYFNLINQILNCLIFYIIYHILNYPIIYYFMVINQILNCLIFYFLSQILNCFIYDLDHILSYYSSYN